MHEKTKFSTPVEFIVYDYFCKKLFMVSALSHKPEC